MKTEVKFRLELALICFVKEHLTKNCLCSLVLNFLKVCNETVAGRDQPLDIFMKETSIEVLKMLVQGSGQSNHESLRATFS